ncbi:hypothetical protein EXE44_17160 [Halorubrum sp. SS7]|uniref:hypothetical protein n=1 Tax=unclassified Halorubrum TaxID=2642239 RepID=UPI0010F4A93F|nr:MULTISPECIES: hypothetical protein [unclassified Halorubrum]TKX53865.1 hypothetical protein EXE44_17160 [Halorubrum sp. SS7]TKX55403.1 hypothetical protein EXE42_02745 [Halorubrum sp. SP3]TKX70606.1 hypothetical protein EXE45_04090 [Halorubrum sp. SP9]
MSGDLVELPIEVDVTPERYGTLRSVNVVSGDDIPPALDSQEWRLEELSVESHVRDQIDVRAIDETTNVGVLRVDTNTLEWEFLENKR